MTQILDLFGLGWRRLYIKKLGCPHCAAQFDIICFYDDYVSSVLTSLFSWKKYLPQAFPCV